MDSIRLKARGKVNIGLDILGKREDGYHEMDMIMQTLSIYDEIRMKKDHSGEIHVTSEVDFLNESEDNLAYKAAKLFYETCGIEDRGVTIGISKNIPISAGMAGGSADAATVLVGMNKLYETKLSEDELRAMGLKLGADVPYCIVRGTMRAQGVGEILTPLDAFPDCQVIIAKPAIAVSTAEVFKKYDSLSEIEGRPDIEGIMDGISHGDLFEIAEHMGNVLEKITIADYPVIDKIKAICKSEGAVRAMMTGSGPTVFALFNNARNARKCYNVLKNEGIAKDLYLTDIFNVHGRRY